MQGACIRRIMLKELISSLRDLDQFFQHDTPYTLALYAFSLTPLLYVWPYAMLIGRDTATCACTFRDALRVTLMCIDTMASCTHRWQKEASRVSSRWWKSCWIVTSSWVTAVDQLQVIDIHSNQRNQTVTISTRLSALGTCFLPGGLRHAPSSTRWRLRRCIRYIYFTSVSPRFSDSVQIGVIFRRVYLRRKSDTVCAGKCDAMCCKCKEDVWRGSRRLLVSTLHFVF